MLTPFKNSLCSILLIPGTVFVLFACGGKSNKDEVIKELEKSLANSNISINQSTSTIMKTLVDKKADYGMTERADYWYPKAEQIVKLSRNTYDYIGELKKSGIINSGKAKELCNYLLKYKETILAVDSSISVEFSENLRLSIDSFNKTEISQKNFYNTYFNNSGSTLTSAILTKLQNEILVAENKVTAFCNTKVGSTCGLRFDSYSPIIVQNGNNFKQGEKLEITAGIGAYSKSSTPKIKINGTNTNIGEEGFALYKMTVSNIEGKYKVPVSISFYNQANGKEEVRQINVEYTIAKPCN